MLTSHPRVKMEAIGLAGSDFFRANHPQLSSIILEGISKVLRVFTGYYKGTQGC
jgi:hypothetical protein